ncbi:MAG TPA: 2-oxoacid:acceptor oxidoreductase subunit alpha [Bacteroidia bacterium]|nr:2-oxoacid:acceptor oxidoreductase subunit alpha [Bacteroidia bacterium]
MSITQSMPAVKKTNGSLKVVSQHVVEIVSDSGEGAQKAGQSFGSISAKMGNGVWTVEIIPAEIQPPARSRAGASGIRIRVGSEKVTNMGDHANLVVALNEQVLYGRISQDAYTEGTVILLENKWASSDVEAIQKEYAAALADFKSKGYKVIEIPMETECLKLVADARKGKNMWVLGMLCQIYNRDLTKAEEQIRYIFKKKSEKIFEANVNLLKAGYNWAKENLELNFEIPPLEHAGDQVVMNGNEAIALGTLAAGIEVCAMYPITPATSASHKLAECMEAAGGLIHQAEDEIAAIGFAIGSSYAGKTAITITSGPGLALKTEFIGLAVMAEVPLVIVNVQRGGPSTGLPTKVEQGDLLASLYGAAGDAPKIIIAPATIEECFHFVILARKLAEAFRMPVIILTDANLATGVSPFPRPKVIAEWLAPPIDQSRWKENISPYNWDAETGLSQRPIPGQKDGMYTLTGLAHDHNSKVAYDPEINQKSSEARSRKLAAVLQTLKTPKVNGDESGDLLVVGWGSTKGAIEEAVAAARKSGMKVSSLHLHFLSPLEPGLEEIFRRFKKVKTVEINYSDKIGDPLITKNSRRYAQLAWLLRAQTLVDVDCYSNVFGQPINPGKVLDMIKEELKVKYIIKEELKVNQES